MKFHDSNGGYGVTKNEFLKRVRKSIMGLFTKWEFHKTTGEWVKKLYQYDRKARLLWFLIYLTFKNIKKI